jgi:hypothetical protein
MTLIHTALAFVLVLVNLAGLTAAVGHWLPGYALARAAGIVILALSAFFVEHFVGLGRLGWAWPLFTAAALYVLYRERDVLRINGFWRAEGVFLAGFCYALFWRISFPSIHPSSERITNLYFVQNYMGGGQLPPLDLWLPPMRFDFYYALQHYAAALLGRIFDLSAGLSLNLAACVLMALPISLAWDFTSRFLKKRVARLLIVATLAIGGTGATPFVHLVHERPVDTPPSVDINDRTWGSARFIGGFDQKANTLFGQTLFAQAPSESDPGFKARELPSENYGYQFALGDFHPPAGGFFVLLLALGLMGRLEAPNRPLATTQDRREVKLMTALLGLTVPLQIATNAWVFPLQGLLILAWILWRHGCGRRPDWVALIGGGLLGGLFLYPFLTGLSKQPSASAISFVTAADHTPWPQFLAVLWPVLLFIALGLLRREWRHPTTALAIAALAILLMSELVFVDDPTGDQYQRTNTTMKWWGYLNTMNIVGLGALLLASQSRLARAAVIGTCLTLNLYAFDLLRYWSTTPKTEFGQLNGDGVYTRDPATREMLRYLANAPTGVVMESMGCGAFCDSGIHALFSGKPLLLGWPMHIQTWRVNSASMWIRKDDIDRFYRGELQQPAQWLIANEVHYVVWSHRDTRNAKAWQAVNSALAGHYGWKEFGRGNGEPLGIWVKSGAP